MGTAGRIEVGKKLSLSVTVAIAAGLLVAAGIVGGALLVLDALDGAGPDLDFDGVTSELGATRDADGVITLHVPRCAAPDQAIVRVSEAGGPVVWELEADTAAPAHVDRVTIGEAPAGFDETVPLASPLALDEAYDVELLVTVPDVDLPPSLFGGAQATFVPDDLDPDQVLVGTDLVPLAAWQTTACP